jgi:hypothetical protein
MSGAKLAMRAAQYLGLNRLDNYSSISPAEIER